MSREVIRTKNFVADSVAFILDVAGKAFNERGEFRMALSGGNTPRPIYGQLANSGEQLPWEQIKITFGDERCVLPDSDQSNYRMARETLFDPAGVPESSIFRMPGEIGPETAAQEYQEQLDRLGQDRGEQIYRHDLILLGMGDDGHTASLFPGTAGLNETDRRVVANFVPKFDSWRLTFAYPLIDAARNVCFLVNAAKHAELIEQVLSGDMQYPAARANPTEGTLTWLIGQRGI